MGNNRPFSALERETYLSEMAETKLDLLVIGGGITGSGIALDASSRGMKVGLVEKQDFAQGTSSRSTKLIHGGLRYLKQGEINLVREVGRERDILFKNAPHIVIPEKMLLPLVKGGTYGKFATSIGLWVYDILAGVKKEERRVMLSKRQTAETEPLLRQDILKGGGLYIEYRTDDARLTIEVLKTAHKRGALCVNYAKVTDFIYGGGQIKGAQVEDQRTGKSYHIYAKKVVNAAGPWVDQLRERDGSLSGKRLHLTKGVHLVVPYEKLPLRQAIYFDVADGRMIFAIPRGDSTYIGTTDTNYDEDIDKPVATSEDVDYLLKAVNEMFTTEDLTPEDVVSSWAGLRPLIHEDGKSPSELSRKDEIFLSHTGLITIAGGKLTGFRKMAERVVDLVSKQLTDEEGRTPRPCATDSIVLSGGNLADYRVKDVQGLVAYFASEGDTLGWTVDQIRSLAGKYGTHTEEIMRIAKNSGGQQGTLALLTAEAQYSVEHEMATGLGDFWIRRTGKLYFEREKIEEKRDVVGDWFAKRFDWDENQREAEEIRLQEDVRDAVRFD